MAHVFPYFRPQQYHHRHHHHPDSWRLAFLVAIALSQLLAYGCADGISETGRLNVQVGFDVSGGAQGPPASAPTVASIQSVTETVYQGDTALVTGTELAPNGQSGAWSGAVDDLPVGVPLTVVAQAFDVDGTETFSGTAQTTLTGADNAVTVDMTPADQPAQVLPHIVAVEVKDHAPPPAPVRVFVEVEGRAGEPLDWALTGKAGAFDPPDGALVLSARGTGSFMATYTAPPDPGTYAGTARVTDSQGNSVESAFSIVVAPGKADPGPPVGPVVTSVTGVRKGHTVTWTATVSDNPGHLDYAWSAQLTGGSAPALRAPADANPAYLDGYDETVMGTLTLQVTDARSLTTTVTVNVSAGEFPDPEETTGEALAYLDGDGVPELTAVPRLSPTTFAPGDTVTLSVPVDRDVGHFLACLYDDFDDAWDFARLLRAACADEASGTAAAGMATTSFRAPGALSPGSSYWVLAMVCASEADCDAFAGTVYTSVGGAETYFRQVWSAGTKESSVDTGVAIPTYTVDRGGLDHDGDGLHPRRDGDDGHSGYDVDDGYPSHDGGHHDGGHHDTDRSPLRR